MPENSSSRCINSSTLSGFDCLYCEPTSFIFTAFFMTNIFILLPLCVLILYLGVRRRLQQRSASTPTSHLDSFTHHMVAMELIGVSGFTLCCCGIYLVHDVLLTVGFDIWYFAWYGETFFHVLTCAERYLAVVHPFIYLRLRGERGVAIRNVATGCVWLLSAAGATVKILEEVSLIVDLSVLIFSLIVISVCSVSVLCALIRPGPGERGGDRDRVDQSKLRAFFTIVVILGVLVVRCAWNMVWAVVHVWDLKHSCMTEAVEVWFNLPCSLVLPLQFLHRAGTFTRRTTTTTQTQEAD